MEKQIENLVNCAYSNDLNNIIKILKKAQKENLQIINKDSRFLANICSNGDINTLEYVLTSKELKEHADINLDNDRALCCAIHSVDISMIKYLLTSSKLKVHSNLYQKDILGEDCVINCIFNISSYDQSKVLIDYFTLDYAIEQNDLYIYEKLFELSDNEDLSERIVENLISTIINIPNIDDTEYLINLLAKIDLDKYESYILNEKLSQQLTSHNNKKLNIKI